MGRPRPLPRPVRWPPKAYYNSLRVPPASLWRGLLARAYPQRPRRATWRNLAGGSKSVLYYQQKAREERHKHCAQGCLLGTPLKLPARPFVVFHRRYSS